MANDNKLAECVRVGVQHLCTKLGVSVWEFGTAAGIDATRLDSFMKNVGGLTEDDCLKLHEIFGVLVAAEDRDTQDLKRMGYTPAPGTRDVINSL